jgi:hypothetical protein
LQGAIPAAWQSQFRGISGRDVYRDIAVKSYNVEFLCFEEQCIGQYLIRLSNLI